MANVTVTEDEFGELILTVDNTQQQAAEEQENQLEEARKKEQAEYDAECEALRQKHKDNPEAYKHLLSSKRQKTTTATKLIPIPFQTPVIQPPYETYEPLPPGGLAALSDSDLLPPVLTLLNYHLLPPCQRIDAKTQKHCQSTNFQQLKNGTLVCLACVQPALFQACPTCIRSEHVKMRTGGELWCVACKVRVRAPTQISAVARPRAKTADSSWGGGKCGNKLGNGTHCQSTDVVRLPEPNAETGEPEFHCKGCKQLVEAIPVWLRTAYSDNDAPFVDENGRSKHDDAFSSLRNSNQSSSVSQGTKDLYDASSARVHAIMHDQDLLEMGRAMTERMTREERGNLDSTRKLVKEMSQMVQQIIACFAVRTVGGSFSVAIQNSENKARLMQKAEQLLMRFTKAGRRIDHPKDVAVHCFRELMSAPPFCYELTVPDVHACMGVLNVKTQQFAPRAAPLPRFEGESKAPRQPRRNKRNAEDVITVLPDDMYMGTTKPLRADRMAKGLFAFRWRILKTYAPGTTPEETGLLSPSTTRWERVERHVRQITNKMAQVQTFLQLLLQSQGGASTGPGKRKKKKSGVGISHPPPADSWRVTKEELDRISAMVKRCSQTLPGLKEFEDEPAEDELLAIAILTQTFHKRVQNSQLAGNKKYCHQWLMRVVAMDKTYTPAIQAIVGSRVQNIIDKGFLESMCAIQTDVFFLGNTDTSAPHESWYTTDRCLQRIVNEVESRFAHKLETAGERSMCLRADNNEIKEFIKNNEKKAFFKIAHPRLECWKTAAVILFGTFGQHIWTCAQRGEWDSKYHAYRLDSLVEIIRKVSGENHNTEELKQIVRTLAL